ncbi:uncharacterized protein, partial [Argopecten irradians]|uniref:uncharacterized protein n=1 Tax=Argopecten irradians TaxID=31199 RepID=UPI0037154542
MAINCMLSTLLQILSIYNSLSGIPSGSEKSIFHDKFMRGPCRQARGYGIQKFKPELYLALEMWLRNTFLKQIEKDYFTMWGTIRGAGDSLLHFLKFITRVLM